MVGSSVRASWAGLPRSFGESGGTGGGAGRASVFFLSCLASDVVAFCLLAACLRICIGAPLICRYTRRRCHVFWWRKSKNKICKSKNKNCKSKKRFFFSGISSSKLGLCISQTGRKRYKSRKKVAPELHRHPAGARLNSGPVLHWLRAGITLASGHWFRAGITNARGQYHKCLRPVAFVPEAGCVCA